MVILKSPYVFLVLFSIILFHCTHHKIQIQDISIDTPELENYLSLINTQYPDSFALSQRIILNVAGKQYDFIGQLTVIHDQAFRAVTFGDMGGQFIDLLAIKDSISILSNPTNIPQKPLMQGVADDIRQIFLYNRYPSPQISIRDSSNINVMYDINNNDRILYLSDRKTKQLTRLESYSGDNLVRLARFSDYKNYNGWNRKLPALITLENHRWHYSLEIRLLKFSKRFDPAKVFNVN